MEDWVPTALFSTFIFITIVPFITLVFCGGLFFVGFVIFLVLVQTGNIHSEATGPELFPYLYNIA